MLGLQHLSPLVDHRNIKLGMLVMPLWDIVVELLEVDFKVDISTVGLSDGAILGVDLEAGGPVVMVEEAVAWWRAWGCCLG